MKRSNNIAFQGGTYSLTLTVIVLAILVLTNLFMAALPTHLTKFDMSASKLYSITSNTKVVLNGLQEEVTIYWVVQSGEEDEIIENLLAKYQSVSDNIQVIKKNPDIYPTFTAQYTDEPVFNNSLIVECGERSRFIGYDDIYVQEADIYSYMYTTSFDGEGAITSAIDYVVNEDLPKVYALEGHGELALPATFSEQIAKENIEMSPLSLLTVDTVPEDADCIMIYAPSSDISEEEKNVLLNYVGDGGKLMVMAGPVEGDPLNNLHEVIAKYGITVEDGIVVEEDRERYAFRTPHVLIPTMQSSEIMDPLIEANYYPLMPIAQPLSINSTTATVTELLTTSDTAFSKTDGYNLTTYEKEAGDSDGPFTVAVSVEDSSGGEIVWFSSSAFLEDQYNAFSSGANADMSMNALSALIGESEAMAIRTKSLNYNYLTISDATSSMLKVLMIGVFPLVYLAIGMGIIVKRRGHKNEAF